jgi:hypothetical protein
VIPAPLPHPGTRRIMLAGPAAAVIGTHAVLAAGAAGLLAGGAALAWLRPLRVPAGRP